MKSLIKKVSFLTVLGLMMGQSINASVALPPGAVSSINIINLPAGYLFAAKVKSGNSVQTPIDGKNLYALYPNTTYYTITRVNRNDTIKSKQHPQSDFAGHDTWDAISDVISNAATNDKVKLRPRMIHVINIPKYYGVSNTNPTTKESGRGYSSSGSIIMGIKQNDIYYISDANGGIHSKQYPASDFTGKTTWDATTDTIS